MISSHSLGNRPSRSELSGTPATFTSTQTGQPCACKGLVKTAEEAPCFSISILFSEIHSVHQFLSFS